jgi:hypothetical protein
VTTSDQPEPHQTASFDQTHAAIAANLDDLGTMYAEQLAEGHNAGLTMAGLAVWLLNASNLDASGLADHLAVSVQRLHDARREQQAAHERGVAEGRRQATEGWEREWGLALHGHPGQCVLNEHAARGIAADPTAPADTKVLSRLVGPWEPAEQAAPSCTCPQLDVTTLLEKPGSQTVKGYSASCPVCPNPYAKTEQAEGGARCSKCSGPLTSCAKCAEPAQCGELLCAGCTPDVEQDGDDRG